MVLCSYRNKTILSTFLVVPSVASVDKEKSDEKLHVSLHLLLQVNFKLRLSLSLVDKRCFFVTDLYILAIFKFN